MPATLPIYIGMSTPGLPWKRDSSVMISKEVTVMVVTIMATNEAEVDEENLPVEEANHLAGTTSRSVRTILSGHFARISTLPVAAQLQIARRSIVAVRDLLVALSATRRLIGEPNMMLNTEQFVFYG